MRKFSAVCVLLALIMSLSTNFAEAESETPKALDLAMESVIDRDDGRSLAGLAVEAIRDGEVVYRYADGRRFIDNNNPERDLPFETDTRVRVASVSKTFVAVGIMQLVEQGKIDLDTDVSDYLGFELRNPSFPDTAITCRMLLSHTSSIRDGNRYSIALGHTLRECFEPQGAYYEDGAHFAGKEQKPGEYFSYANLNYGVLGTLLEAVSGERFDRYMLEHVFRPMGVGASFHLSDFDESEMDKLAVIYRREYNTYGEAEDDSGWVPQIDGLDYRSLDADSVFVPDPKNEDGFIVASVKNYVPGTNATIYSPHAGLRISADELAECVRMFMNDGTVNGNQILTPESVDTMFTPVWTWNGSEDNSNGDVWGGLYACWGLGIQIITNGAYNNGFGDNFLEDGFAQKLKLAGHYGNAYGGFSVFMLDRDAKAGFVYICNGTECSNYSYGNYSQNWIWAEEIVTALFENIFNTG